ncbi:MAG: endonuclease domain-containing protein [Patescibacteria group bacterium]
MKHSIKLLNQKDTKHRRRELRKEMTKAELVVWSVVRNNQLGHRFRRQHGIGRFIVDFYCPILKLIVEVDGEIHGEGGQPLQDKEREAYLRKFNFRIKRYHNDHVLENPEFIRYDLKKYCDSLKSLKPSPNPSLEGRGSRSI